MDKLVFTACTGAVTGHFYRRNEARLLGRLGQWTKGSLWEWAKEQGLPAGDRFDVITLTFGGNDIGFPAVIRNCMLGLVPSAVVTWSQLQSRTPCGVTLGQLQARIDRELAGDKTWDEGPLGGIGLFGGSLADFYRTLAARHLAPEGRVVVVGYPRLFAHPSQWQPWNQVAGCWGITADDARTLNRAAEYLDGVLASQVAQADRGRNRIVYQSVLDAFGGHELCGREDDWINGIRFDGARYNFSFHVNDQGHEVKADLVTKRLIDLNPAWDRREAQSPAKVEESLERVLGCPLGEGECTWHQLDVHHPRLGLVKAVHREFYEDGDFFVVDSQWRVVLYERSVGFSYWTLESGGAVQVDALGHIFIGGGAGGSGYRIWVFAPTASGYQRVTFGTQAYGYVADGDGDGVLEIYIANPPDDCHSCEPLSYDVYAWDGQAYQFAHTSGPRPS